MNLNDIRFIKQIDAGNMLHHIDTLPDQLSAAWDLGKHLPLPKWNTIKKVIISGMGGSAIGGDLVSGYLSSFCSVPILVSRDYDIPAWANSDDTLFIASSHSGNTEETISSYHQAVQRGCKILTISTGGELTELAKRDGYPAWVFRHDGMPRAAVGYSFGLILAVLSKLGLIPDQTEQISRAVADMKQQQILYEPEINENENYAKQLASQFYGKWICIFGSGHVAPVARSWKGQINELAKAWAQFDILPEADHNTLAGTKEPSEYLKNTIAVFLNTTLDHVRNQKRAKLTADIFSQDGIQCESVMAKGDNLLSQIWTTLHLGDYVSFYLSVLYQVDPTPILALQNFKKAMTQ